MTKLEGTGGGRERERGRVGWGRLTAKISFSIVHRPYLNNVLSGIENEVQ